MVSVDGTFPPPGLFPSPQSSSLWRKVCELIISDKCVRHFLPWWAVWALETMVRYVDSDLQKLQEIQKADEGQSEVGVGE